MKAIKITSKLTKNQLAALRRQAERCAEQATEQHNAFYHSDTLTYTPGEYYSDIHDVARRMMTVAGATFDYEIVEVS